MSIRRLVAVVCLTLSGLMLLAACSNDATAPSATSAPAPVATPGTDPTTYAGSYSNADGTAYSGTYTYSGTHANCGAYTDSRTHTRAAQHAAHCCHRQPINRHVVPDHG